jgi:hypothetical protein
MSVTFDLITVVIKKEPIQARPIEWEKAPVDSLGLDASGTPVKPSKYMTTCPHCAQLIKFSPSDLYDGIDLKCPECKAHTPPSGLQPQLNMQVVEPVSQAMTIEQEMAAAPEVILQPKVAIPVEDADPYPFVDPVAEGRISTDNYVL